jgi:hypothetical protein
VRAILTWEHIVAYLGECTLATVETLRSKKSASKSELARQEAIAAMAVESFVRLTPEGHVYDYWHCQRFKAEVEKMRGAAK